MNPAPVRPMRILLTLWFRKWAGDPRAVQELASGLIARGHHVLVACPADGVLGQRLLAAGIPVRDLVFERGWSLRAARSLAALVEQERIELIDTHAARDRTAALLARVVYRMPARLVFTRRAVSASFPLANVLYAAVADRIVAISHAVAQSLVRGGTPRRKVAVIHTGIHPERLNGAVADAEVQALREEFALDPALPTVGVVARRKDQETLLRALALHGRPTNVLMIGIERDAPLAALEPALPAGTRIGYTGFRERVLPFYRLLDVMVLTTRGEGLSQTILEALAVGVPVISAAAGGTVEVISHGENGLLYPPADAAALAAQLQRMLDDPALRRDLARRGAETVQQRFHVDVLVRQTEALYAELIGDHGARG